MIETRKYYIVTCDRCGEQHVDFNDNTAYFSDEETARESAANDGWVELGKRHYCPNCYDMDNNIDDPNLEENE